MARCCVRVRRDMLGDAVLLEERRVNDRQLLEAAAKAAGLNVLRSRLDDQMWRDLLL